MVFDGAPPIINNSRHTGTRFKHKSRPNGDNKANQSHVRAMEIKIDSSQVNHSSLEVNKMQKLGLKSRYPWDMGKGTRWKRHASVLTGDYPLSMRNNIRGKRLPKYKSKEELALVKGTCDFLGINYYTTYYAKIIRRKTNSPSHYDDDLHVEYHNKYNSVIFFYLIVMGSRLVSRLVGHGWLDELNSKALTISKARVDETRIYHGLRVKGYFIWSLIDNIEWAKECNVRFGIFYVDFLNEHSTKFPKRSAMWRMNFLKKPKKTGPLPRILSSSGC
ncbi:beta-glucosidase-like [Olea europaea var. sylvestris]|uniref:beta-glucosidase-like n=1 Tax=Olea europaea var. sylvestris TaxID=158386 RepID=UPI000C1D7F33|nr:beta-glucosidase-like [Olea europaea var. sylvestris]